MVKDKEKRMKSSGGLIANNFRQGSRAEVIAQYFLSEFCIAERVVKENDFGIDLYCSLMNTNGSMGYISTLFGVQIKSGDAPFQYAGEYVAQWLKTINIPLIMCRVDQKSLSIKLYSTWMINSLIAQQEPFTKISFEESYSSEKSAQGLKMPIVVNGKATVWMGPPIINCKLPELINGSVSKEEIEKVLEDWVKVDCSNYSKRHVGIPVYYGYTRWEANKSLDSSNRSWYRPHHYRDEQSQDAIKLILECTTLIALNRPEKKEHPFVKGIADIIKKNEIIGVGELDSWEKEQEGID